MMHFNEHEILLGVHFVAMCSHLTESLAHKAF